MTLLPIIWIVLKLIIIIFAAFFSGNILIIMAKYIGGRPSVEEVWKKLARNSIMLVICIIIIVLVF